MPYLVIPGAVVLVLVMCFLAARRTLDMLDENIRDAMGQIGVQISFRWDALSVLMDLIRGYASGEYKTLAEIIKARRPLTTESLAWEAVEQEILLVGAMARIAAVAERYPALKTSPDYRRTMDSVNQYEGMARQSRLVYNDSVTKLNRRIRMFPTALAAGLLGYAARDYFETNDVGVALPARSGRVR